MPTEPSLRPMSDQDRSKLALLLLLSFEKQLPLLATGSRIIGGATNDSDWDYVLLCERGDRSISDAIESIGFERSSTEESYEGVYGNRMTYRTYRCGKLNLIVSRSRLAFNKWGQATELAKAVRPQTKQQRIQIFDAVFGTSQSNRPMYLLDEVEETGADDYI